MGTSLPFESFRNAYNWISNFKMFMIIVFSCLFVLANSMAVGDVEKRAVADTSEDLSKRMEEVETELLMDLLLSKKVAMAKRSCCYDDCNCDGYCYRDYPRDCC